MQFRILDFLICSFRAHPFEIVVFSLIIVLLGLMLLMITAIPGDDWRYLLEFIKFLSSFMVGRLIFLLAR